MKNCLLLLLLSLLIPTLAIYAKTEDMSIELEWLTEGEFDKIRNLDANILNSAKIAISSINDKRNYSEVIGKYIEDSESAKTYKVSTTQNIPEWVESKFKATLNNYGVNIVDKSSANFLIDIYILKFFVLEEGSYKATTALNIKFSNKSGTPLFERRITGKASAWGKTYKDEYYNEVLSESLINAGRIFLNTIDLYEALSVEGGKQIPYEALPKVTVKLNWNPTKKYKRIKEEEIALINGKGMSIGEMTDSRKKKDLIASYTEEIGKTDTRIAVVNEDVKVWAHNQLKKSVEECGVEINKADAEYSLDASLLKYFVRDKDDYNARAEFLFVLKDKKGAKAWEDVIKGRGSVDGRAWIPELYNKSLSNAYVAAISRLLGKRGFLKVFETGEKEVAEINYKTLETPLNWEPSDDYEAIPGLDNLLMKDFTLKVNVVDSRANKKEIGKYIADAEKGKYCNVVTNTDIANWVKSHFSAGLSEYGLPVSDSLKSNYNLNISVTKLFVDEAGTYEGNLNLKCELTKTDGTKIWAGMINGYSKTWGKTFQDYNYRQIVSDCLVDAVMKTLMKAEFRKALLDN